MSRGFELPGAAARHHSELLCERLRAAVAAAGGWLAFEDYMDLTLYAPGLGYYSAGARKFGADGDFVTAPVISPLFARCLARASAPVLAQQPNATILELGAGTGALAIDLLLALEELGELPTRYYILEVSADLRERQRDLFAARAPALASRVQWLDTLPVGPLRGVIIANEVADALPVTRFVRRSDGVRALGVTATAAGFEWQERPADAALAAAVATIEAGLGAPLAAGYVSEVCLRLPGWIAALSTLLAEGVCLLCDYGGTRRDYYHPDRRRGTLICHYRHQAHEDVFWMPGLQDISAWVDFTALAQSAVEVALEVAGFATQAHFLIDTGVDAELARYAGRQDAAAFAVLQGAKTLLLPGEMGERFKVMALRRGAVPVAGFGFRDLRARL